MRAARAEDQTDWTALYSANRGDLFRTAVLLVGSLEAEELVQETFERALRQPDFLTSMDQPAAWLRTVIVRLALTRLRRRAVLRRIGIQSSQDLDGPDPTLIDLKHALSRLADHQRAAVVLRYFYGLDYREIGQTLRRSENSIGPLLSNARQVLKEALK